MNEEITDVTQKTKVFPNQYVVLSKSSPLGYFIINHKKWMDVSNYLDSQKCQNALIVATYYGAEDKRIAEISWLFKNNIRHYYPDKPRKTKSIIACNCNKFIPKRIRVHYSLAFPLTSSHSAFLSEIFLSYYLSFKFDFTYNYTIVCIIPKAEYLFLWHGMPSDFL